MSLALRADIPYVGWLLVLAAVLMIGGTAAFAKYFSNYDEKLKRIGNHLMQAALVVQAIAIGVLVYQIKSIQNVVDYISTSQYERFAVWMLQQEDLPQAQINLMGSQQLFDISSKWISENASKLHLSLNANQSLRPTLRRHHRHAALDDARLFCCDLRQRIAEPRLMVQRDVCDDARQRRDDVRGIKSPAEAGFPNH